MFLCTTENWVWVSAALGDGTLPIPFQGYPKRLEVKEAQHLAPCGHVVTVVLGIAAGFGRTE